MQWTTTSVKVWIYFVFKRTVLKVKQSWSLFLSRAEQHGKQAFRYG